MTDYKGQVTESARHYGALQLSRANTVFGIYDRQITLADVDKKSPVKPIFCIKPYVAYVVRDALPNESTNTITYNAKKYIETDLDDIASKKVILRARIITSHIKSHFNVKAISLLNDAIFNDEYNVEGGYVYAIQNLDEEIVHNTKDLEIVELAMLIDFTKEEGENE